MVLSRQQQTFLAHKPANLTRTEIIEKVGNPNVYLPESRVACYQLNILTKRHLALLLIIPLGVESTGVQDEIALLQFDENDRLIYSVIQKVKAYPRNLSRVAERFAETNSVSVALPENRR
jgi:hypothetical protein